MTMDAATLQRLSSLLDRAFELDPAAREDWLAALDGDDAALVPTLRELLARTVSKETADFLGHPPAFTVVDADAAPAGLAAGDLIGAYRLLRLLGRGGMGEVWLAERDDGTVRRKVALKLPHVSWSPAFAERFARERDILAFLEHPHIARLYDAGVDRHGRPFMALEYVEGKPIDVFCREGALGTDARLRLLLQVADAVAFAHSRLVLHRDLKPGNMLVTADGNVHLLDFGIAKMMEGDAAYETALTRVGGRALTLDYASPEQIRGEPLGTASDVYSLAVVAFEILSGGRPYRLKRRSAAELEEAIASGDAPLASEVAEDAAAKRRLRGDLDAILQQALRKAPVARYPSANAFAEDIERHLRGEPVVARPDTTGYRLRKFVLRNRIAVAASAAVLVAVVSGAGVAVWQASVARAQSAEAQAQAALAKKEAQRAQAVQGFMFDLFRTNTHQQADPLKAQRTTARELLDIGAARVSAALKDAPEAEIQVLNTLSDMYVQLGLRDQAIALQRRSVEVGRRIHGPADPGRADAILSYAATLQERPQRSEIPALLDEAKATLDAAGENTTFLRGALLMETARYNKHEGLPVARDSADAAVAFFRRYHPQRASLVTCYRLAGQARMQARDYAQAEVQFQAAVDAARLRGQAAPAWLVGSLADLGEAQQAQMKFAAAEASLREALAHTLKINGESHRETLNTRIKLANLLLLTGRTEEGLALQGVARASIEREKGRLDAAFHANVMDLFAATALTRGRPQEAIPSLTADVEELRTSYPRSTSRGSTELTLAETWIAMGRLEEARPMLAEAVAHRKASLGGIEDASAWLPYWRVQAQLARAEGDPRKALDILAKVPADALAWPDAEPIAIEIERSHALRMAGRTDEAADSARRALASLQSLPAPYSIPHGEAAAWEALGAAELALGRRDEARDAYSRAVALRRAHGAEGSVWLAQDERALALLGKPRVAAR
ncbi:MAG: protein kinase [Burkholderiales bacterium]